MHVIAMHGRDTRIGLGNDRDAGCLLGHAQNRHDKIGCAHAAIRAESQGRRPQPRSEISQRLRADAHHGAPCRIETGGDRIGHPHRCGSQRRRPHLLQGRHGLDPDHIGPTGFQAFDLLDKDIDSGLLSQCTQRREQIARWPHRTCHHNCAARGIGHITGNLCRLAIEVMHTILGIVQHQATPIAAEGIGQDDIGPSFNKTPV